MAERTVQKSLVEQILDDMFANIEELEEFDAELLQKLKQLAVSGNLKKAPQIIRAIKAASGGIE
jgi:hypothetical protein